MIMLTGGFPYLSNCVFWVLEKMEMDIVVYLDSLVLNFDQSYW